MTAARDAALAATRRAFLVCHFLRWLPAGLLLPVLVLLLTERGLSLTQVGFVFAVYGGVTSVLELPTGGLADALGRKPVLLLATVFDSALVVGLLLGQRPWHFLAAAAVGAVGRALLSGPLESWYVDTVRAIEPTIVLRPALSAAGVVESASFGVGALLSAVLPIVATGLPLDGVVSLLTLPLLAGATAEVASFVAVALLVQEAPRSSAQRATLGELVGQVPGVVRGGLRLSMSHRDIRLLLVATFVLVLAAVSVEALWQPRFASLLGGAKVAVRTNGFIMLGLSAATALGAWVANHLPRRIADHGPRAGAASLVFAAAALAGLAAAGRFWPALAAFLLFYVGLASLDVIRDELLHDRVPGSRRATMLSTVSLSQQAGNVVSSLVLTRFADIAGIPAAWWVGAVALLAAAGIVLAVRDTPVATDAESGTTEAGALTTGAEAVPG